MTIILDIINGIHRFLGYLDISPKYLNRGYTLLSVIPTLYLVRIMVGLLANQNYLQFFLYTLAFIVLMYFILLNCYYYFFDKNSKADVTQFFVKYLPEEAFNLHEAGEGTSKEVSLSVETQEIPIKFYDDYQLKLDQYLRYFIDHGEIAVNDVSDTDGFFIDRFTLFPYYYIKEEDPTCYTVKIGYSYDQLVPIGEVQQKKNQPALLPLGLYIIGGDFVKGGVRYHEPYSLQLICKNIKDNSEQKTAPTRRSRRAEK